MTVFKFSKSKLAYFFISNMIFVVAVFTTTHLISSRGSIEYLAAIIIPVLFMLLFCLALTFAVPFIKKITFLDDHFIIRFGWPTETKTIFYKDLVWFEKNKPTSSKHDIATKDEKINLFLLFFPESDRVRIIDSIRTNSAKQ